MEHGQAKWIPVRRPDMRPSKKPMWLFDNLDWKNARGPTSGYRVRSLYVIVPITARNRPGYGFPKWKCAKHSRGNDGRQKTDHDSSALSGAGCGLQ
jgi:hypothetical protein